MSESTTLLRVFVKGGIISPADLLRVMDLSKKAGNSYIMFGSRQDIIFPANPTEKESIQNLLEETSLEYSLTKSTELKAPRQDENIVSSYVALDVMETTWWLKDDVYYDVLDSFDYQPVLKVNIIDPIQSLVPLFTGHLNFIASRKEHYWYLFIRKDDSNEAPEQWPELIHGNDIAKISRKIENILLDSPGLNLDELREIVTDEIKIHSMQAEEDLRMPTAFFPYYEGLNSTLSNLFWLGLYWRNNRYDIEFLSSACRLCRETNAGKICITPWKSFIIKGIRSKDRILWKKLMGKFGLNLRHSSLELNWHLPVMDEEALELKRYLVRELNKQDISTHGLTFSIKTTEHMLLFTSVVIEKDMSTSKQEESLYNIRYARKFNPNHSEYFSFAKKVEKSRIPELLIKLSKLYFRELEGTEEEKEEEEDDKIFSGSESPEPVPSYQCSVCMTIYDKKYGDPESGIKPGTPFEELSENYTCPLCSSTKDSFIPVAEY